MYRQIAGEHLLIALHKDAVAPMFALTPSGAALWEALKEWTGGPRLVELLLERYEIDSASAERDVHEFLEQLLSIGAIAVREVGR